MDTDTRDGDNRHGQHSELAELLPEYALGLLPADEAALLERHLSHCPVCRQDLGELTETVALLPYAPPPAWPRPEVKEALLARLSPAFPLVEADRPEAAEPARPLPAHPSRAATGLGAAGRRRLAALAAAAALVALLGWNVALQRQLDESRRQNAALMAEAAQAAEERQIAHLFASPSYAHALTESELTPRPVGYIYTDPERAIGLVLAYRMPPLPPDQRYQLWLILPDGARESGGLFAVDPSGNGQMVVRAPRPLGSYRAVGITVEPQDGSPTGGPTGPRVVGGPLQ
jgi:anti-sigma-K factor RskA